MKNHERIDLAAPADAVVKFDFIPEDFKNDKPWKCCVLMSAKTSKSTIDDRIVYDGYSTTKLGYYYSNKTARGEQVLWERENYQKRLALYNFLEQQKKTYNYLIVRIHFLFPCGPGPRGNENHQIKSQKLAKHRVVLNWNEKTFSFLELSINIDSSTLDHWGLFGEEVVCNILSCFKSACMYLRCL